MFHIYDSADPDIELGGLILSTGVTNANFFLMIEIIFLFEDFFEIQNGDGTAMERDDDLLRPRNYYMSGMVVLAVLVLVRQLLMDGQVHSQSIMKLYWSAPGFYLRPELGKDPSDKQFVHRTVDVL